MKLLLSTLLVAACALAPEVSAVFKESPGTVSAAGSSDSASASHSAFVSTSTSTPTTTSSTTTTTTVNAANAVLDKLTTNKYSGEYHMKPVRVVHARVQSDTPMLVDGQFVSSYGNGDLAAGYLSAMDSVNTASVEGALMYVQAEGINYNSRSAENRCQRKTKMANIVFYEILIAQTNETIAQFQSKWEAPEYGPMIPMDSGRCTPLHDDVLPVECYQFNGDNKQPDVGPFVGGESKDTDVRAPYPGNYWFSFPNTCPTEAWANKTSACRNETRKGLCPVGEGPDGVECTFAYNILGWVPIDDVVGITSIVNNATGKPFANFTQWCNASDSNIEFEGSDTTGTMTDGLAFWSDPTNSSANAERAQKVLDTYAALLASQSSSQINATLIASFKPLPSTAALEAANPPCYRSVASCGSGSGCKRVGYSQLCTPCTKDENCTTTDGNFVFPNLTKAFTTLSDNETSTPKSVLNGDGSGSNGSNGTSAGDGSKSSDSVRTSFTMATVAVSSVFVAFLALL